MSSFCRVLTVLASAIVICGLAQGIAFADTIGYWQFDEQAPGHVAANGDPILDSSGNGHNGTVADTWGTTSYAVGPVAGSTALHIDSSVGYGAHVAVPASAGLTFPGSMTIEAYFRTQAGTAHGALLDNNKSPASPQYFLTTGSGTSVGEVYDGGATDAYVSKATGANDGNWHQLAMVYDRTAGVNKLYLDYALVASTAGALTGTIGSPTVDVLLGETNVGDCFWGDIDFLKLSNVALSVDQFQHPVPEPGTLTLLGCGLIGLLAYAWRKRR